MMVHDSDSTHICSSKIDSGLVCDYAAFINCCPALKHEEEDIRIIQYEIKSLCPHAHGRPT